MQSFEREAITAKLLSGITFFKFQGKRYKIINPNPDQMGLAEEIASEGCLSVSYKQLLSEEESKKFCEELLLKRKSRIGKKPYFYEVADEEAIDLDNLKDFEYLEYYVKKSVLGTKR